VKKKSVIIASTAAALALAGGGIAYASIPDSGGTFHACVKDATDGHGHMVRMLDSATETCDTGWTEKKWHSGSPLSTYQVRVERNTIDGPQEEVVSCNSGDLALSGGWRFFNQTQPNELQMYDSHPAGDGGWQFGVFGTDPSHAGRYFLYVNCGVGG